GVVGTIESRRRRRRDGARVRAASTAGRRGRWFFRRRGRLRARSAGARAAAAATRRRRAFDERIKNVWTLAVDVYGNAPQRSVGPAAALQPRPGFAGIG